LYLRHWGVPAEDIFVTGIPIHPVFSTPKDRAACLTKHGLDHERPVVLQLSGGLASVRLKSCFTRSWQVQKTDSARDHYRPQRNAQGTAREDYTARRGTTSRSWGFTKEIDELMQAADLVVTKPGGPLTTSEVLAREAIMVIVNPIPGQESRKQRLPAGEWGSHQGQQHRRRCRTRSTACWTTLHASQPCAKMSAASHTRARRSTWWRARWN